MRKYGNYMKIISGVGKIVKKLSKNNQSDESKFIVRKGIPFKIFYHIFFEFPPPVL